MNNKKIINGKKLLLCFGYSSLLPCIVIAVITCLVTNASFEKQFYNQLVAVREAKSKQVEDYFSGMIEQVCAITKNRLIADATSSFTDNISDSKPENSFTSAKMQNHLEKIDTIVSIQGEEQGNNDHQRYHHLVSEYLAQFENYEMFIVEPASGKIVYSNSKELDFFVSLMNGPYTRTNFERAFQLANSSSKPNFVSITDFEYYPPLYNHAACFIASPIFNNSMKIGVLLCKIPIDEIDSIMTNNQDLNSLGLGKSGKTYIVGSDLRMRSQSRSFPENEGPFIDHLQRLGKKQALLDTLNAKDRTVLLQKVESNGIHSAISGETNVAIFPDYRNIPVIGAYAPLNIKGLNWVILTEIDKAEAFAPVYLIRNCSFIIGFIFFSVMTTVLVVIISDNRLILQSRSDSSEKKAGMAFSANDQTLTLHLNSIPDVSENKAGQVQDSYHVNKAFDFLDRCGIDSEREDSLANECKEVMNAIKNTIAKQSEQLYHICDKKQYTNYTQEELCEPKRADKD
ncbi:MAG: hypothetical protein MRK02_15765 [Candidatus Scalindua sp.]|nr:hypothetical protein [Candidatus Scalindua sp.]